MKVRSVTRKTSLLNHAPVGSSPQSRSYANPIAPAHRGISGRHVHFLVGIFEIDVTPRQVHNSVGMAPGDVVQRGCEG